MKDCLTVCLPAELFLLLMPIQALHRICPRACTWYLQQDSRSKWISKLFWSKVDNKHAQTMHFLYCNNCACWWKFLTVHHRASLFVHYRHPHASHTIWAPPTTVCMSCVGIMRVKLADNVISLTQSKLLNKQKFAIISVRNWNWNASSIRSRVTCYLLN